MRRRRCGLPSRSNGDRGNRGGSCRFLPEPNDLRQAVLVDDLQSGELAAIFLDNQMQRFADHVLQAGDRYFEDVLPRIVRDAL